MVITLKKVGIKDIFNLIKVTYDKSIARIVLNDEKLKAFVLKSGMRQRYPLSTLFLNIVLT
jgi:hypothetical protein